MVKAYKKVVAEMGEAAAFDLYMEARLRLENSAVTPASLHKNVADILEWELPYLVPIQLPAISDPFELPSWEAWWEIFWIFC
ncbi:MAG: hypothetical protein F4X98_07080 [Gammaproteobacteria bacterium]|nr:hypothetical protein [Gammaproteobacteria bacterium]